LSFKGYILDGYPKSLENFENCFKGNLLYNYIFLGIPDCPEFIVSLEINEEKIKNRLTINK